jgi:spermidine/putrescine transport system substrate-binding protein
MVYNGDAIRGMTEDPETHYFVPREGGEKWLDCLSIPAKAPHRDLAEQFINYILEPKVGARVSEFTRAATPNQAALELINPVDRNNTAIYPPSEVMRRLEYANDLGDVNKLYDELWTQIKAK